MAISLQEHIIEPFNSEHLVGRLQQEKQDLLAQVEAQGFNFGVKSAASLSYEEFHRIECLSHANLHVDADGFTEMWDLLDSRQYKNDTRLEDGELSNLLPADDENKGVFVTSWMKGVLSVWNQIKEQVDDAEIA